MIYLTEAILIGPVTLVMAWWHSRLIKANRPIRHGWWALLFAALVILGVITLNKVGAFPLNAWKIGVFTLACAIGRLVVFNISLNYFRGLSLTYVSKASASLIDKVEIRLFGSRVWLAEVVLAVLFITLQFFI